MLKVRPSCWENVQRHSGSNNFWPSQNTVTEPSMYWMEGAVSKPYAGLLLFLISSQVNHRLQETSFWHFKEWTGSLQARQMPRWKGQQWVHQYPPGTEEKLAVTKSRRNTINKNVQVMHQHTWKKKGYGKMWSKLTFLSFLYPLMLLYWIISST